ncbi:hypothetical protein G3M48_010375 [Beauveria asiatica]|uniref:Uncharacterized protein n=1 Tax=Beauveria asiatica TaxID=1069075 RepID=A0AAW0RH88_9HYPO
MFLAFKTTPSASAGAQLSTAPHPPPPPFPPAPKTKKRKQPLAEEAVADGDAGDALASTRPKKPPATAKQPWYGRQGRHPGHPPSVKYAGRAHDMLISENLPETEGLLRGTAISRA